MRVGVVGCGGIGRFAHLRVLNRLPGASLVAAADPDPEALNLARRWSPQVHAESDELLARADVDAVVVAVPTHLHAEVVEAACAAGKHVYVEKPLASDRAGAERIRAAVEGSGATLAVGFNRRRHPTFERARAAIDSGMIGRVRAIQSRLCEAAGTGGLPPWKRARATGGGVLLDLASHHVDLVRWMLRQEIVAGEARVEHVSSEQDVARVRWSTDGGVEVQSFFSFRAPTEDRMAIVGDRGSLRIDRHHCRLDIEVSSPGRYLPRARRSRPGVSELLVRVARAVGHVHEPSYRRSLAAFVAGLESRPAAARPAGFEDGLRALEALLMLEAPHPVAAPARR